ncbi:MAG: hypothetical protein KC457_16070, partial [Myxococcales bacterium]|nr:hypothetical protein [Myxococcales bacterium]
MKRATLAHMGIFDRFRRKPSAEPQTPAQLFEALKEALVTGEAQRFEALCREHRAEIVAAFPSWQKPGKAPEDLETTVQVLGTTAQFLATALGEPEPWRRLTEPEDNPFVRWQAAREGIMQRVEVLDYAGAVERALALLVDLDSCSGSGRDQEEEITRGMLGQLLRHLGRVDEALPHLEWTLARCQAQGDAEGIGVYLRQLHEADRDRGRPSTWALRLAEHLEANGDADEAAWLRSVVRRFPEGEPLLRMVVSVDGRRFELDEARLEEGRTVQVLFQRNREVLAPAQRWTERGREHGSGERFEEAIACFVAAAEADVHDP